jgi:Rps23 Pro-64 3,4-dihydroxylase Tpa1-like proline 4-hydroxylase
VSDHASLKHWIQDGHLEPAAIGSYRKAFASNPARALVLKHVLLDNLAEALSRFLSHEARFETVYGLYSEGARDGNLAGVSPTAWFEAEESQRFYRFSDYAGVLDEFQASTNQTMFEHFFSTLRSNECKRFFEAISGLVLGRPPLVNAYSYRPGDFLNHHTDDVKGKRLSFVFYLSIGWRRQFGGVLNLIDSDGRVITVDPDFNSLVIFDVAARTRHFISPVERCAGERARLTISGWFLTP